MGKKASGIAQIIVGALIIVYMFNSSLVWSSNVKYGDDGTITESTTKLTGFEAGQMIMPLIIGGIIIYFGIRTLKRKEEIEAKTKHINL